MYKHTQISVVTLAAFGLAIVFSAALFMLVPESRVATGFVLPIFLICIFLFYALTVQVTPDELIVAFGPGIIRRSIRVTDIKDARAVRNKWWYGWGIRLTPYGWMFNVYGLDAIELEFADGRKFRIGTDDPDGLLAAIQNSAHLN